MSQHFIPYQIDHSVQNTAKTIGFSKKRIIFKFGFADPRAIYDERKTGPECRGSEHEVILLWSLKSGKRQLFVNGKEIHYSISQKNGWTNDTSWQHVFPLQDKVSTSSQQQRYKVQFITQPANSKQDSSSYETIHPFDLKINNLSYFSFNPIYQLGTPRMIVGQLSTNHHRNHRSESPMSPEERQQLALAKLASLQDMSQQRNPNSANSGNVARNEATATTTQQQQQQQQQQDDLLISFDDADQKDLAAMQLPPAAAPEHSITSIGFYNNNNSRNNLHASSITLDQHYPSLNTGISSSDIVDRQQPGSYHTGTNPYASSQPSYGSSIPTSANPYQSNHNAYYSTTGSGTGPTPSSTLDSSTTSTALTPYQPSVPAAGLPPSNSSYYPGVGSTSYYNSGSGASSYPQPPPSYYSTTQAPPAINTGYNNVTTNPYDVPSPSATTVYTYGSAPSFAQPPKPPTTNATTFDPQAPPTFQNAMASTSNPYGNTAPMSSTASPYQYQYGGMATNNTTSMYPPLASPPQSFTPTPAFQY